MTETMGTPRQSERVDEETGELIVVEETNLARPAVSDGEINMQVSTAKRFPRNIGAFKKQAMAMACLDEETAAGCFYSVPRDRKTIEGPSTRLAEIVASAWGNLRAGAYHVAETDRFVISEGFAWDLETNVAVTVRARRRITDRHGRKYGDDMIAVTAQAANAIAFRNAVFKVVPRAYTQAIYEEARRVAIGDVKTLANKRAAMLEYFQKMGITPERILARLDKPSVEDLDLNDLAVLKGTATALKEGTTDPESAFPEVPTEMPDTNGQKKSFGFGKDKEPPDAATKMKAEEQVRKLRETAERNTQAIQGEKPKPEAPPAEPGRQADPKQTSPTDAPAPAADPENQQSAPGAIKNDPLFNGPGGD